MDIETYALAKRYTDTEIAGGGAIKGKNCVITEIEEITGGHIVHFQWTLDDGTVETDTMTVMDGEDGTIVTSSETNGNIKINGVETTVYDDSKIKGELSTDYATVEGNPLNFSTLSAQNAKSTLIDIEPIQDLHGYDKPWVGGAGKNLIPLTIANIKLLNTTGTWNDLEYTISTLKITILLDNANNVIGLKANGTPTARVDFVLSDSTTLNIDGGRYTISGSVSGSNATIWIANHGSIADEMSSNGSEGNFTYQSTASTAIKLTFFASEAVSNLIFLPMLRKQTEPSGFAPYENKCPITGRTQVGIEGCGKNLLKVTLDEIKSANAGGTWTGNKCVKKDITWTVLTDDNGYVTSIDADGTASGGDSDLYIYVNNVGNYYFSGCPDDGLSDSIRRLFCWNFTTSTRCKQWDGVTNVDNCDYSTDYKQVQFITGYTQGLALKIYNTKTVSHIIFKPMLCLANAENPAIFEPYTQSTNLTISFGQTVYGGQVDVEKGILRATHKLLTIDGTNVVFDSKAGTDDTDQYMYLHVSDGYLFGKTTAAGISVADGKAHGCICNQGDFVQQTGGDYEGYCIVVNPASEFPLQPRFSFHKSRGIDTVTKANAYAAENPIQFIYPLATPIEITLEPHQISLLKGVNNISTDGDKITLTYRDGSVATLEDVKLATENLEQEIADSQILTDTVTGDKYKLVIANGVLDIEQISNEPAQALSFSPGLSVRPINTLTPAIEPAIEPQEVEEEPQEEETEEEPIEETEESTEESEGGEE
jgi:hypothetical protein